MKYYSVYILQCADDTYYVGVTNNLERRLQEHSSSFNSDSYTSSRLPVVLVYQEDFSDVRLAISREKQIKGWSREKKEILINQNYKKLIVFSKRKSRKEMLLSFDKND